MEATVAQTKMLPTKISIKEEAKCQQSSAKTTWIYIQKKRQSRVAERPQARGVRSPGFSARLFSARLFMVYWHILSSCWVWVPHLQALVCSDGFQTLGIVRL